MRNKSQILPAAEHQLYVTTNALTASYLQLHLYKREPAPCNKIARSKIPKTATLQTKKKERKNLTKN